MSDIIINKSKLDKSPVTNNANASVTLSQPKKNKSIFYNQWVIGIGTGIILLILTLVIKLYIK